MIQLELLKKLVEGEVLSEDIDIEEMLDRSELGDLRERNKNINQVMAEQSDAEDNE